MTITSKYPGRCTRCGGSFAAGTPVNWVRGTKGATHASPADCTATAPSAAAMPGTITSKFAGRCTACGCAFPAGTLVNWTRGVKGATHATPADCAAARAVPVPTADVAGIVTFLNAAMARGLKAPKVRFVAPTGGELMLSLSKFGAVVVKIDGHYRGVVAVSGHITGALASDTALIALLVRIAADPATAAKEYGVLHCRCSFCRLPLSDEGSVEVGYGKICASHWGLPHEAKGRAESTVIPADFVTS